MNPWKPHRLRPAWRPPALGGSPQHRLGSPSKTIMSRAILENELAQSKGKKLQCLAASSHQLGDASLPGHRQPSPAAARNKKCGGSRVSTPTAANGQVGKF